MFNLMQPINDNDGIDNYHIFREVDGQNFRCGCTPRNGNGDVTNKKIRVP